MGDHRSVQKIHPLTSSIQTVYFLSEKFARVDCPSLNFRPAYLEFSRRHPTESTRLKSFLVFLAISLDRDVTLWYYTFVNFFALSLEGYRSATMSPRFTPFTLSREGSPEGPLNDATNVYLLSAFVSSSSRSFAASHVHDRNALNPFRLKRLRTTFFATEGWVPPHPRKSAASANHNFQQLTHCFRPSPHGGSLCFHEVTHCPICKPFLLIMLQQYPGVCIPPTRRGLKFYFKSGSTIVSSSECTRISTLGPRIREVRLRHAYGDSPFCLELTTVSCRLLTGVCHSEAPSGRKYCVPFTGSCSRRRSCCKSSLRSTKSISEVLITRRSEAE